MLNVIHTLERMEIDTESVTRAFHNVSDILAVNDNIAANASKLINSLLSMNVKLTDNDEARVIALAVIEAIVLANGVIGDEVLLYENAVERARVHMAKNAWMYVKAETASSSNTMETKAVAAGVDTKVAVRKDGSIGRGGKQVLAAELFNLHVVNGATPCDNACFVKILMKELQMSIAGARTYAHNLRKQHGMVAK